MPPAQPRRRIRSSLVAVVCLGVLVTSARPAGAERLPMRRYTTADGIPHDRVKCIVQDRHGFLWFCTVGGVSRFDGYGFTTYDTAHGLPNQSVNALLEDGDGEYWIATNGGGVCRFTAATSRCRAYPVGPKFLSNRVNVLHEDRSRRLWAGTDAGLFRLDSFGPGGTFHAIDLGFASPTDVQVRSLMADADGSLWIGTSAGLVRVLPDGRLSRYVFTFDTRPETDGVKAVSHDPDGRLWVGHDSGLIVMSLPAGPAPGSIVVTVRDRAAAGITDLPDTRGAYRVRGIPGSEGKAVQAFSRSSSGSLWFGTLRDGLTRFDGRRFSAVSRPHEIDRLGVTVLTEDRDGNLWIGTTASGAIKVARNGFTTYDASDGLATDRIVSIFEDAGGELVIVTAAGLFHRFDGERFTNVRPNMPAGFADGVGLFGQVALQDHKGDWWIRSNHGLFRFGSGRLADLGRAAVKARYTTRDGLASDNVSRLFEDSRGNLWIGMSAPNGNVLAMWDRAAGTLQPRALPPRPLAWTPPLAFAEDRGGNVWIGFAEGRVVRFGPAGPVAWDLGGTQVGAIRSFHVDRAGRLWFASDGGGLGRIDRPLADDLSVVRIVKADGLSNDHVVSIAEDERGRLHLGTLAGVDRLGPGTDPIKHYTTADGLAQLEQRTAFRDRRGRLWFGTVQGLSSLVPDAEPARRTAGVRITGIRIAGAAQLLSALGEVAVQGLVLPSDRNQLQIDFVSIALSAGELLRYQYRLDGADQEWMTPTAARTVNYASLSPGTYRFLVRAVTADGVSSAEPASLAFTVLAPVWRRGWFLALTAMAIGVAIHRAHRYRVRRLVAFERVRTRIAGDLHDDIGSTLSQIAILGEVAQARLGQTDYDVQEVLSRIGSLSRESVVSMSDIVWATDPHKDHLASLTQRMRRFASELLPARGIAFRFTGEDDDVPLGPDVRRQIFVAFKETLNNAVRHSGCACVTIELRLDRGSLVLRVADDGRGFDPDRVSDGQGLASLKRRAQSLGGTLDVASGPGTCITLRVPYRRPS